MFTQIRLLLVLVIAVLLFFVIRKSKLVRKKMLFAILLFTSFILIAFLSIFPIENRIVNFNSPEEVFDYTTSGNINDIIHGNNSSMVVYSNANGITGYTIIPKVDNKFIIPNRFDNKTIINKSNKYGSFKIITYSGTDNYYLFGSIITDKKAIDVYDSNQNQLRCMTVEMGQTGSKTVYIYGLISDFYDGYYLQINNTQIEIV